MSKPLFINLHVNNTEASKRFFESIGLRYNEEMTDDKATCFNLEDNIVIALLPTAHFKETLSGNEIAAPGTNEAHFAIGMESRQAVDDFTERAVAAGAKELHEPYDLPDIYGRAFSDLDGHLWNAFYTHS